MFTQFIKIYNTINTYGQKESLLQQTLQSFNNLDGSIINKELHAQYNQLSHIFKIHPKLSTEFLISKISIESCIHFMNLKPGHQLSKQGNSLLKIILQISQQSNGEKDNQFLQSFSKMYTKYSSYQKILVFLRLLSSTYHKKFTDDFVPQFLADFIKASAIAIEAYLKLKAQSPKFDVQYLEHGEIIVNSTQKWIKNYYIELLKNLRIPENSQSLKISLLNGVCDIIGALLQVQREGNIQNYICQQILDECYNYVKKITNLQEFNNLYMNLLREKKFNIPHHKIIIPEKYTSKDITFPKQSFAYIVFKFLNQSFGIYSNDQVVRYLLPVINQFSHFDYEVKSEIEKMFIKVISAASQNFESLFSRNFPLSILWFNLEHYKANRNTVYFDQISKIFEKVSKKYPETYLNSLKILSEFETQGFENEKLQMIGEKILELQNLDLKELKILLKEINLSGLNEKCEKVWCQVINKASKSKDLKAFILILIGSKDIKENFRQQLLQIISS